ncbi:centromere protein K isoform X1 [Pleuronectes platessa]|uniref:centromere protein K isoform X1 n=1 Tax=Pleuronectes platessa TaxID=8262 RepID=UPI00232A1AC6|nr:centromere protein K isoform X1 [Pleuronectes platessa]
MAELRAAEHAAAELSEAAQAELLELCEEQFSQLEKLQNEIILSEPDYCENLQEQSVNRLIATEAELKQWLAVEPKLLAANSEVLLEAGKEEMLKLSSELEMVASCYEAKTEKLRETKELELKWLEEKKQVLLAASDRAERLQLDKEKISEQSILQDTKAKIHKMKVYQERLMECLGDVLEKHVPLPQIESSTNKKKKNIELGINENLISLNEILEMCLTQVSPLSPVLPKVLMNKVLSTPHDTYVTIDDTFWPPYIEMLLRYGIAVRHQENHFKIRLETFF